MFHHDQSQWNTSSVLVGSTLSPSGEGDTLITYPDFCGANDESVANIVCLPLTAS